MRTTGADRVRPPVHVLVSRWLLLGAVVTGILGMHVLTGGDAMDHHAGVPAPAAARPAPHDARMADHVVSAGSATPVAGIPATDRTASDAGHGGSPGSHDAMAGCVLFLTVGAALLLARTGRARTSSATGDDPRACALHALRRRGPPRWPLTRLALGVSRI